uniref:Retrotransposon Copia-like N-terminal domain-containing protein n=1 Tax=Nicotiana tabacum TaxID=4097 RepID=A0A1S3YKU7_TOBAC|nr:PREDICTED: uncharacterized protein LOC107777375 [Nicotiana tabacum]
MAETTFHGERHSATSIEAESSSLEASVEDMVTQGGDSSHMSFQLTSHRLNGKKYLEWAQSVKLAIDGSGKLGHMTGETIKPEVGDPKMNAWRSDNSLVIAWLINSMDTVIGKSYIFLPTARDVWEAVRETYSYVENASQIFELKIKLWQAKQDKREVTAYYNEMVSLWQELDQCYHDECDCPADSVKTRKGEENEKAYLFLAGLNRDFDEFRSPILGKNPLPSIRETLSEIRREESRGKVMLKPYLNLELKPVVDASALATVKNEDDKKKRPWCDHCKKYWHTRETCWKIHGKPPNTKKKEVDNRCFRSQHGEAFQTTYFDQGQQPSPETSPFTREQLELLQKLLQSPQF